MQVSPYGNRGNIGYQPLMNHRAAGDLCVRDHPIFDIPFIVFGVLWYVLRGFAELFFYFF